MQQKYPTISKTTIYNVINVLAQCGLIKPIKFKDSTEIHIDTELDTHYNFVCKVCGNIYSIEAELDMNDLIKHSGHELEECVINIYGKCRKCKVKNDNSE